LTPQPPNQHQLPTTKHAQPILHPISKRPTVHDWRGDYIAEAVATGHPVVLELLLHGENAYQITWQNAQELVKLAAKVGNADTMRHLFAQPTIQDDKDELEESVDNALKVAAEEGQAAIVDYMLANYSSLAKSPCPAALLKATMYGHTGIAHSLQKLCNVSASNPKLQVAGWLGALFNAARGGHTQVVQLLLKHEEVGQMLTKLYANLQRKKDGPPVPPNPEKDPLAVAAARGHLEIVEALSQHRALCAPCAAIAAAAAGHTDVFVHLVSGPADSVLEVSGQL